MLVFEKERKRLKQPKVYAELTSETCRRSGLELFNRGDTLGNLQNERQNQCCEVSTARSTYRTS